MTDIDKVIQGIERCLVCDTSPIALPEAQKAYLDCEYTVGLYCGRDILLRETLEVLKEQKKIVRCGECKHFDKYGCRLLNLAVSKEFYCADGERRDADG